MPIYNPNDFYPKSGAEIDSTGNVKNDADGLNADGSKNVVITGDKVVGPTLIDTITYTSFTASTTLYKTYTTVLSRGAKKRTFVLTNTLNQPITSAPISLFESTARQGINGGYGGDTYTTGSLSGNSEYSYTSDAHTPLALNVDSFQIGLAMGATVPTSGNFYVYVTEIF